MLLAGRFRILEEIGRGAFSVVARALDEQTGQVVALKAQRPGAHEPLLWAELHQLRRIHHPCLPQVIEVGRTEVAWGDLPARALYLVTQWREGRTLAALLPEPVALRQRALLAMLQDIGGALAHLHAAGLLHRDVSLSNILWDADTGRAGLLDLGLAIDRHAAPATAAGTPAILAPEALIGRAEPRSDLYSLGVCALALALGRPPLPQRSLDELVTAIVTGALPPPPPELAPPVAALLSRLTAREPSARPASAAALLDELAHALRACGEEAMAPIDAPTPPPPPLPLCGRAAERQALRSRLAEPSLTLLAGSAVRGAAAIAQAAAAELALAKLRAGEPAPETWSGTLDELAARLGSAEPIAAIVRAARQREPAQRVLLLDAIGDARAAALVRALARPGLTAAVVVYLEEEDAAALTPDAADASGPVTLRLPPLPETALAELWRELTGQPPLGAELAELARRSAGEPVVAAALAAASRGGAGPSAAWSYLWQRAALPIQRVVTAAALWPTGAPVPLVLATAEPQGAELGLALAAERAGLLQRGPSGLTVLPVVAELALAQAPPEVRAELAMRGHHAALQLAAPALAAAALSHVPARAEDAAARLALARQLADSNAVRPAEALLADLERLPELASAQAQELAVLGAELALARGDYPTALARAARSTAPTARLWAARAQQRSGALQAAEAELRVLLAQAPPPELAREAAHALGRVLVSRGQLDEAAAAVAEAATGARAEVLGLVAYYRGDLAAAEHHLAAAERAAEHPIALGRALSMRGMVAQQRGQLALAGERYQQAAELLAEAAQAHAAATADLNLGTVLTERGRHAEALAHIAAASLAFRSLGAHGDWVAAEVNRGNCLLGLGDLTNARRALAVARAHPAATLLLRAFADLTEAEALRRDGDLARARALGTAIADTTDDAHARLAAHVALAEAGGGLSHDELDELATSDDDRQKIALACARRAVVVSAPPPQLLAAAATAAAVAQRALAGDRQERAFRGFAVAATAAAAAGDEQALPWAQRALSTHAALVAAAPPASQAAMLADPDRRAADALVEARAEPAAPPPAGPSPDGGVARRLLALSLRLNREVDLQRILDEVIDTAIELSAAERGFLLLRGDGGRLAPVVARNFGATDGKEEEISRSIAERAAQSGEPVITIDAGLDSRFDAASSVAALRLRSVLAVPLRQRGAPIGCIYVDHRLRRGAFDERAATLLAELADIAAIAIANAQLTAELRQRNAEIEQLNRALTEELAERDAELVRVRAGRPLRQRYDTIIGTSAAIGDLLQHLDRAAATSFPVVILGESGTGKELVARALHEGSARRAGPFVAVNCSALPDTLLESELFGHVRGAFTGADRDRRGMFEIAHGGTLLLDEIADTSPAMQARLLRVLEDGVVRRLGDARTLKVDVRVLAAGQRPLDELVAAGRFREDLRFRLEVLTVVVPPLRERPGDLPLLAEHLLRRLRGEQPSPPPRLSRAALRALAAHRWPGNVRELANVLAHGLAMAGEGAEVIELGDLPAALSGAARGKDPSTAPGADLRLRPALRATERAYLRAALERTGGNQTAAARLLGLSRFGLQKKLRRGDQDDEPDGEDQD